MWALWTDLFRAFLVMILNYLFIMLVVSSSLIGLIWEINKGNQSRAFYFLPNQSCCISSPNLWPLKSPYNGAVPDLYDIRKAVLAHLGICLPSEYSPTYSGMSTSY